MTNWSRQPWNNGALGQSYAANALSLAAECCPVFQPFGRGFEVRNLHVVNPHGRTAGVRI